MSRLKDRSFPGQSPDVSRLLSSLSPAKKALLERRLRMLDDTPKASPGGAPGCPATAAPDASPPTSSHEYAPLSYPQELLWHFHRIAPDPSVYNECRLYRLRGPMDPEALEQAFRAVVDRHEVLRMRFAIRDGRPVQVPMEPRCPFEMGVVDLAHVPAAEAEIRVEDMRRKEARRPFDLACDWPLRAWLIRLESSVHYLLAVMHTVVSDGWSNRVMFRELSLLYNGIREGRHAELAPMPLQYADYARWQRERLASPVLDRQSVRADSLLARWRTRLEGAPALLDLDADRPRPAARTFASDRLERHLDDALVASLEALGSREEATLFMVLLAAYAGLLFQRGGQDDIVIGSRVANRHERAHEGLVGLFMNVVPLRVDLGGDPTFAGLLARVRDVCLEAFEQQELPFQLLLRGLSPPREPGENALFQAMFIMQVVEDDELRLAHVTAEHVPHRPEASAHDITLYVARRGGRFEVIVDYSVELFDRSTMERFLDDLETLLGRVAKAPELPLSHLLNPSTSAARPRPLSFAQQRLWFLDRLDGGSPSYNIPLVVTLRGRLRVDALRDSLHALVKRHEMLRTCYGEQDSLPCAFAAACEGVPLPVEDLAALPPPVRDAQAQALAQEEIDRPFDLRADLMARFRLIRLSEEEYLFVMVFHHIAFDGWSLHVFCRELATSYAAISGGSTPRLHPLPMHYHEYAIQQRRALEGEPLERLTAWWQERLAGAPPRLDLPFDRPREATTRARNGRVISNLPGELARDLESTARRHGCTLFMLLLAAFKVLLHRYTGQDDLVVGAPVAGRISPETEGIVGCFINMLAMRTDLSGDPSFVDLLGRVRETSLAAFEHQDMPFEKLVERLAPERSLYHHPIFQTVFALQNMPRHPLELEGLDVEPSELWRGAAQFDLSMTVVRSADGLQCMLSFNADLFDAENVRPLGEAFATLLRGVTVDPSRPISRLPLLSEEASLQVWSDAARVGAAPPAARCLHHLFEDQVAMNPSAVAVEMAGRAWSYGELHRRALLVAEALHRLGAGAEDPVALYMPRTLEAVAAIVGIVQAGAAWLPIDPTLPAERVAMMLEDARPAAVVALDGQPALGDAPLLVLDEAFFASPPLAPTAGRALPSGAAYVLYTSGSTGRPKGVVVEHASAVSQVCEAASLLRIGAGDRLLQFASLSFDLSVQDVWMALSSGATLVLRTDEMMSSLPRFVETCATWQITSMFLPTAFWHELAAALEEGRVCLPPSLRVVIFGGERALPDRLEAWQRAAGPARVLLQTYGPTEATVFVTTWDAAAEAPRPMVCVPIGDPLPGVETLVLDAHLEPVPAGAPGELFIGGRQLARGYLGRPELTAERFIPHPMKEGARLYRTGDRVRRLGNGLLEFLGRLDDQLKIRGYRVEPGEIETVLETHPGVHAAAVVAHPFPDGTLQLVACVVPAQDRTTVEEELSAWLSTRLPEYMVPFAFTFMPELPLTPTGKINRRALPPSGFSHRPAEPCPAPLDPIEAIVAGAWSDLLGVDCAACTDHFFKLGGHSLMAMRAVGRLEQAFGIPLQVRDLFEAPTVREFARRVGALLEGSPADPPPPLTQGLASEPVLSFAQQRIWLLEHLVCPGSGYNVPVAFRLRGSLDAAALARSLRVLVDRHETLRTCFGDREGHPFLRPCPHALPQHFGGDGGHALGDLGSLPPSQREARALALAREEAFRPFDLSSDLMVRCRLIRMSDEEHVLILAFHHIAVDGWSVRTLLHELAGLYAAFRHDEPLELPSLPVTYRDYAAWQVLCLQGNRLARHVAHWREKLEGAPERLELPFDHPRSPMLHPPNGRVATTLSPHVTERLESLAASHDATLFMATFAAFGVLLHRYGGETDLVVGTPVAGRTVPETDGLVGFFVNTLALRIDLSGDPPFSELLSRVRKTALEAYDHQDLPFEKLVVELEPARSLDCHPIFQVMFALQDGPELPLALEGLAAEPYEVGREAAQFDLTLSLARRGRGLRCVLDYNAGLFDARTVEPMLAHYQALLEGILADPSTPVSRLRLMKDEERQLYLAREDAQARLPASRQCLHELFEEQARLRPEAVAVEMEGRAWTYRDLQGRARALAGELNRRGAGLEDRVALAMDRSPEAVAAILGILGAGAAWVPLDPSWPSERLAFVLEDAAPVLIVASAEAASRLPAGHGPVLIADAALLSVEPTTLAAPRVTSSNAAYVIYTSGSTGRPKGVVVEHGSAASYVCEVREVLGITPDDRVLQFSSLAFDVSVCEIGHTLASGATLVVRTDEMLGSMERFIDACASWKVTVPSVATAFWHELVRSLEAGEVDLPSCTRLVLIGGERALPERMAAWQRRVGTGVRLVNGYGPTETTVGVTFWDASQDSLQGRLRVEVPIGFPLRGVEALVLDPHLEPVPVGVPGELYLGGRQVARGYLNRPELTAERFLAHPFRHGARLYRTGDRVRRLGDGTLEYRGRTDDQVKIRGFRVEPGEIEAVLDGREDIKSVAVVARPAPDDTLQLVAYVVPKPNADVDEGGLRAYASRRLPAYMVPSAFVFLQDLPRTTSGKVDRRALPAPDASRSRPPSEKPRSPLEELVAQLWSDLLKVGAVGRHDNFFDLGGHSLLAMQATARLGRACGVEVGLRALFEAPTVAALAERIERARSGAKSPGETKTFQLSAADGHELSFAQRRLWFIERLSGPSPVYNVPMGVRLRGPLDRVALERALERILERHEVLRVVFRSVDGEPVPRVLADARLPMIVEDLAPGPSETREEALQQACLQEARRPFDLEREPMLRARLFRLGVDDHALVVVLHHIASDGWSVACLRKELHPLYEAFAGGGSPEGLPDLPVQYRDFAAWQNSRLSQDFLQNDLEYWRRRLEGAPPLIDLRLDHPRPLHAIPRGASAARMIPEDVASGLEALARRNDATLFMVCFAAFYTLLHRTTAQDDIVVGTPVAGRPLPECESLIGFFVNTLALRTDLSGDPTGLDLLGRVRQGVLEAFDHREMPFDRVVEELAPVRSLYHHPVFQVAFTMQHDASSEPLTLPGLAAEALRLDLGTSRFDLTVTVSRRSEGLRCGVEYNAEIFDRATAARWLETFEVLLRGFVSQPGLPISRLPLMGEEQRKRLVAGTIGGIPPESSVEERATGAGEAIHGLFEQQARSRPAAVAIETLEGRTTYAALDQKAEHLAGVLRDAGVRRHARIGICLERSPEMVATMLAILKVGAAYVPLDPDYPLERLAFMVDDAALSLVVARRGLVERLPRERAQVLVIEDGHPTSSPGPVEKPAFDPEDPAYVCYTSGSTGQPKGVLVPHRAVVRLVRDADYAALGPSETLLALSTTSFDAAVFEIWGALCNGARLVLMPPGLPDLDGIARVIARFGVTIAFMTTGLFQSMVDERVEALEPLRVLLTGGDVMSPGHARKAREALPDTRLVNIYGPTETTVFACFHTVGSDVDDRAPVPLGRPLSTVRAYVVDAHGEPVPVGVPGELWLGGDQVGLGYLHRPDLTAERFRPDPFQARGLPGGTALVYRTGDRVRWRNDGHLEFLGRLDHQVKIRGFRVEPGEVEACLSGHPLVRECVVTDVVDGAGDRRLAAFVVPAGADEALLPHELSSWLAARLPAFMVPVAWTTLDRLPLDANGKPDRRHLKGLALQVCPQETEAVRPRDRLEAELVAIWEELLRRSPVGVNENFFRLGGHSLLAARLVARIGTRLGRELPLAAVFQAQTVEELARILRGERELDEGLIVRLHDAGAPRSIYWLHSLGGDGGGGFSYYRTLAPLLAPEWNSHGIRAPREPYDRIEAMAAAYVEELRKRQPLGPYVLGGFCFGGLVAFEMARQLEAMGETVSIVLVDSTPPLSWSDAKTSLWSFPRKLAKSGRQFLALPHGRRKEALVRAGRRLMRKAARLVGVRAPAPLEDHLDLSLYPADYVEAARTHWRALVTYERCRVRAPILLFRSAMSPGRTDEADYGWSRHTDGVVSVTVVPGAHEEILARPHASTVAAEMKRHMAGHLSPRGEEQSVG